MSRSGSRSKLGPSAKSQRKNKGGKSAEPDEDEGPAKLEVPQLEWMILTEDLTKELAAMEVEDVAKKLSEVLSLSYCEESLKEAAELDYFVSGYWFAAREENFTNQQVSAFFTLLHSLLDNLKMKQLSLLDNVKAFKERTAGVGLPPSPTVGNPLKCFTVEIGVVALRYIQSTLFQHYSLFQFLLSEEQEEERISQKLCVEVPPESSSLCPPPLEEAVTLEFYERCINPEPANPDVHVQEQEHTSDGQEQTTNEGTDVNHVLNVSAEDLKTFMETMAKTTLTSYQDEVSQKLKKKEETMLNRLSKLEKSLS